MIKVFKIGGNVVDNPAALDSFLSDFATVEGAKILIHGGGKIATQISKSLGIQTTMIEGRRVTDADTLGVVTMVYAGGVNKDITSRLQRKGLNTIGLCGVDGALIRSHRRKPNPIDYGFVGDPYEVNTELIKTLTDAGYNLVVAPITYDPECGLLNTNADTVAASVATGLAALDEVELIYCFEKSGVLLDVNDESSLIEHITREDFARLKAEGVVADGMLPKLENSFKAIDSGVARVRICSAENIASGRGTVLE